MSLLRASGIVGLTLVVCAGQWAGDWVWSSSEVFSVERIARRN